MAVICKHINLDSLVGQVPLSLFSPTAFLRHSQAKSFRQLDNGEDSFFFSPEEKLAHGSILARACVQKNEAERIDLRKQMSHHLLVIVGAYQQVDNAIDLTLQCRLIAKVN